jgi:hypothetical protein
VTLPHLSGQAALGLGSGPLAVTLGAVSPPPEPSCADANADGDTADAHDCAGEFKSLHFSPATVTCAGNPCTATECCTVCPNNSIATCSDLGWPTEGGDIEVCAESDAGFDCAEAVPFAGNGGADLMCQSVGARLCTSVELQLGEGTGTGCGHDLRMIWSSSYELGDLRCDRQTERVVVSGNSNNPHSPPACMLQAAASGAVAAVRCCADIECTEPPREPEPEPEPEPELEPSCADANADGDTADAHDCAGEINSLHTSPATVTCAGNPCTATECCTVVPPPPPPTGAIEAADVVRNACSVDQHVSSHACVPCVVGTENEAGDDPREGDTQCTVTTCDANHRVLANTCQPCATGYERSAGDLATGGNRGAPRRGGRS